MDGEVHAAGRRGAGAARAGDAGNDERCRGRREEGDALHAALDATSRSGVRLVPPAGALGSAVRAAVARGRQSEPALERTREMALVDETGIRREHGERLVGAHEPLGGPVEA